MDWSLDATYCGATGPRDGDVGGYAAAKTLCENQCATSSAHVCSAEELIRSASVGLAIEAGKYDAPWSEYSEVSVVNNCGGWSSTIAPGMQATWDPNYGGFSGASTCNLTFPFLCCD